MKGDHNQVRPREGEDQDRFLEHHVAALFLVAQPQVVESGRHHEAHAEDGRQHQVLPELGHQQR